MTLVDIESFKKFCFIVYIFCVPSVQNLNALNLIQLDLFISPFQDMGFGVDQL